MKSVRLHGTGDLRIHAEPVPAAGDGEKLIRVRAIGIRGSDLHWFSEGGIGNAKLNHRLVLGHEFAGTTEEDQRLAIDPAIPAVTVNFVNMVIPIYMRTWSSQGTAYKMARFANRWHGMRIASSLRNQFEITTSNHGR
jgi:NADPH:quinone reductase-like Zn-dependent oxidoreductase